MGLWILSLWELWFILISEEHPCVKHNKSLANHVLQAQEAIWLIQTRHARTDIPGWMCRWLNLNAFLLISGLQTKNEIFSFHVWSQWRASFLCEVQSCYSSFPPVRLWVDHDTLPSQKDTIAKSFVKTPITLCRQRAKSTVKTVNLPVLGLLRYSLCTGWERDANKRAGIIEQSEHLVMTEDRISILTLQQCQPMGVCHLFFSGMRSCLKTLKLPPILLQLSVERPACKSCRSIPKERWEEGQEGRVEHIIPFSDKLGPNVKIFHKKAKWLHKKKVEGENVLLVAENL